MEISGYHSGYIEPPIYLHTNVKHFLWPQLVYSSMCHHGLLPWLLQPFKSELEWTSTPSKLDEWGYGFQKKYFIVEITKILSLTFFKIVHHCSKAEIYKVERLQPSVNKFAVTNKAVLVYKLHTLNELVETSPQDIRFTWILAHQSSTLDHKDLLCSY